MLLLILVGVPLIGGFVYWFLKAEADLRLHLSERFGKKPDTLAGKVVWITGASSGIGEYLAYELAKVGCKLVLSARRAEELKRVQRECVFRGNVTDHDVLILPLDVLQCDKHEDALGQILLHFGQIDILVNNAGRSQRSLAINCSMDVDRQMMDLNFHSQVSLTKVILPHMVHRKTGQIVITSSLAGKIGVPNSAMYSATKFALQGYFDALRVEHYHDGINVVLVCPGPVFSAVQAKAFTGKVNEEYGEEMNPYERRIPTARCAELMAVAMANNLYEVWISYCPPLLFSYLFQYTPSMMRWFACLMGIKAVNQYRHGQNPLTNKSS